MRPAKVSATTGPQDIRSTTGCSPTGGTGKSSRFVSIPYDNNDLREAAFPKLRDLGLSLPLASTLALPEQILDCLHNRDLEILLFVAVVFKLSYFFVHILWVKNGVILLRRIVSANPCRNIIRSCYL